MIDESLPEDLWRKLDEPQLIFLATSERGRPWLRPVTLFHLQRKLLVCTFKKSRKVKQIEKNPKTEFCIKLTETAGQRRFLRVTCNARIVEDDDVKEKSYNRIDFIRKYFESSDDPRFTLIELRPLAWSFT